jgi:glycosyltransferase involved in cell wall biosynthesis
MIGEIERRKNQAGVLRACQRLVADNPGEKITLVLIGKQAPTNPYEFLEKQARQFVNVEHLGYVPDHKIGDVLRSCDAFVYPSLWEGFGIPVLEAMSAGVPVVCSKNSSLTEVGAELAFYCDPYDPVSIAEAIGRAINMSAGQRQEWIREGRQRAAAFTWSAATTKITGLIRETCETRPIAEQRNNVLDVFQSCRALETSYQP